MEVLNMSRKELDRLHILKKVHEGFLTQVKAAELLEISDRQIRNLLKALRGGEKEIISKKRGQSSNRSFKPSLKSLVLKLICENYEDFGPTLVTEKLLERHNIFLSTETVRKWMIEAHLWVPKQKEKRIHPPRKCREYFGEMLQGDGSHHDWFENSQPCTLMYFIDDATKKITAARFEKTESLEGYFDLLAEQVIKVGRPQSIYTDRFSVFETACKKENLTQFRRALNDLNINWIGANSPQAKGRIERCNRTLQDRLIKEMRLKGIKTIEEGNRFLEEFLPIFNNKFSREAMKSGNLHRPLEQEYDISRTLARYEERTLTKDLTFQFKSTHYRIFDPEKGKSIRGKVEIRLDRLGKMRVFIPGKQELNFKRLDQVYESNNKILPLEFHIKHTYHPGKDHPFKNPSYRRYLQEKELKIKKGL